MDPKERLVQSFLEFKSNTVSPENVALARDCVQGPREHRYHIVNFDDYIRQNQDTQRYLIMMTAAYDLLLKYVINLLKVKRPQVWRSIKTNNTAFKARVACMKGADEILRNAGYTEARENAMCFPDSVEEPNKESLAVIAAELLMAKLEVEEMSKTSPSSTTQQQMSDEQSLSVPSNDFSMSNHSMQSDTQLYQPQAPYNGQTNHPNYTNSGQPPYTVQPPQTFHPSYTGQLPHIVQPSYTGQPPYSVQLPNTGQPLYSGQLSYAGGHPGYLSCAQHTSSFDNAGSIGFNPNSSSQMDQQNTLSSGYQDNVNTSSTGEHSSRHSSDEGYTTPPQEFPVPVTQQPPVPRPRPRKKVPTPPITPIDQAPPPDDILTSMGSHRSSNSSEMVSLSSNASDDSSSSSGNTVISKAKEFLDEYRAKKKADDVSIKRKTADLTHSSASIVIPQSSTSVHSLVTKTRSTHSTSAPSGSPDVSRRRGTERPKLPPKKKQPSFRDDTILEQPEKTSAPVPIPRPRKLSQKKATHTSNMTLNNEPAPIRYCPECKNKLGEKDRFCSYCGTPATPTNSVFPPSQDDAPPLRVSHQEAVKAEQQHRQTQLFNISTPQVEDQQPPVPPRSRPRPVPPPKEAWKDPPPRPPKTVQPQAPLTNNPPQAWGGSQAQGDSSVQLGGGSPSPAIKFMHEKEKAWKEKQRRDGVREEDLKPLPELVEAEKKSKLAQQKIVNGNQFPRKNLSAVSADLRPIDSTESERVDQLNREGLNLLESVKRCVPYGYSLDEIQLAYNCNRRSLDYLQNEWREMTERSRANLSHRTNKLQQFVGTPSQEEMRAALAQAGGDMRTAENAVFEERQRKVKELLSKVGHMRYLDPNVPELSWEGAVRILSSNNMEVETAFYVLQCDWLKPLYEFIFDENNKNILVNQTEMEEIKNIITNEDVGIESRKRLLMAECKFPTEEAANIVFKLLEEVEAFDDVSYPLQYYIEAAKDHGDIDKARSFLIKECEICVTEYPVHEFVALLGCIHSVCKECFRGHFKVMITEKEVKHFTCPVCKEPDMANKDITEGVYLQLFMQQVKQHLDVDTFKMCDDKLKEFSLLKDPNFVWCANTECRSGFIHEGRAKDITCPNCRKSMCRDCKTTWEPAHEGITCDAFAKWKIDNDPKSQELGLAAHLQANGIECPQCKFKYDLARGGCMHFKCVKCPNEFCSGCGQSFKQGQDCGKLDSCKNKGLHAHHPRDCLFYLRDFDVKELQAFLQKYNIAFDTVPKETAAKDKPAEDNPADEVQAPAPAIVIVEGDPPPPVEAGKAAAGCRAMLQKETPEGLKDEECGKDVPDNHAGLCQTHYKEYLVDLINKNKLDPITMYDTVKIEVMLTREEMEVPDKDDDDDEQVQREKLIQHVKDHLPLPNGANAPPLVPEQPQGPVEN